MSTIPISPFPKKDIQRLEPARLFVRALFLLLLQLRFSARGGPAFGMAGLILHPSEKEFRTEALTGESCGLKYAQQKDDQERQHE